MAPTPSTLMSLGSKRKEPSYVCLSEAKASHSHKMWTEDSSPVPHFIQMGVSHSPSICRCLLKVLCPVSRPITTLDWVLLKDNNLAPVARLGPEINSRACLCVLQGTLHNARCCFSIQLFIFLLLVCLETPKKVSGPTNRLAEPFLASLSAISFPVTPGWPGTQYSPTACRVLKPILDSWWTTERDKEKWAYLQICRILLYFTFCK
jgi:hypothetical protein